MQEKRRSKRMDIDVKIHLNELSRDMGDMSEEMVVDVVNISKDGLGFTSEKDLKVNTFYDANIVLWTKETFDAVFEIVRKIEDENGGYFYGCRFIGIQASEQLKIQIYEMLQEAENRGNTN